MRSTVLDTSDEELAEPTPQEPASAEARAGAPAASGGWRSRLAERLGDESGMTTAEYAMGTVAACGMSGVLYEIVKSPTVFNFLLKVITKAFSLFL